MATQFRRLFPAFAPDNYVVNLAPNSKSLKFTGSVLIHGEVKSSARTLRLHARELKIKSVTAKPTAIKGFRLEPEHDELLLTFSESLAPGDKLEIKIEYTGAITKTLNGIYPAYYGEKPQQLMLATQFESIHAREVIPCIDEPEAKATFQLNLTLPEGSHAISNTETTSISKPVHGLETRHFDVTPRMSTYLLAFVIGDLRQRQTTTTSGVKLRIFATPEHIATTAFALDFAKQALDLLENIFGSRYPLAKCDLVAVPDFAAGAMENWGLITFRESALLYDPKESDLHTKQRVADVVAHELAHQWFGNLVTMRWWDDLWLNEGFASWIAAYVVDKIFPEWDVWADFVAGEYAEALHLDGLSNTHPIEVKIRHPLEVNEVFDAISYRKGASAIRMLFEYIGEKAFLGGLKQYLKDHAYDNAVTADLWEALERSAGKPVRSFMSRWTRQAGYPIVTIADKRATQERFLISPLERARHKGREIWPVILSAAGQSEFALDKKAGLLPKPLREPALKLNRHQTGFYRLAYPEARRDSIVQALAAQQLPTPDAIGFVDDILTLSIAGYLKSHEALKVLPALRDNQHPALWRTAAHYVFDLLLVMNDEQVEQALRPVVEDAIRVQYERLGWAKLPGETNDDTLLRAIIMSLGSRFGLFNTPDLSKLFAAHLAGTPIDPDIRSVVYAHVARDGSSQTFKQLLKLYRSASMAEEKNRLARALTNFPDESHLQQALALVRSEVRPGETVSWIFGIMNNRYGQEIGYKWIKTNWPWIKATYGQGHLITYFVSALDRLRDEQQAREIERFFAGRDTAGITRTLAQTLEIIRYREAWRDRDRKELSKVQE